MQLDQKVLIEEAVQASIDAGLAVNGEHGVAAARATLAEIGQRG